MASENVTKVEQKSLLDVSVNVRNAYQKAMDVINKRQADYGIELLKAIIQKEPAFEDARRELRHLETIKSHKMNAFQRFFASIKAQKFVIKGTAIASKNPKDAMALAEEALSLNLFCNSALNLLANAAKNAGYIYVAIEARELILESQPENESYMSVLEDLYHESGDGRKLLHLRQKLAAKHPNNLEFQAKLREAAALATIEQGDWNNTKQSSAQKAKAAKGNAPASATLGDRVIRSEEDIRDTLIQMQHEVEKGNESIDMRRKMAELYYRSNQFEKAIEAYNWVVQKMGTLDPSVDKAIEKVQVAIAKRDIDAMRAANAPEEEIKKAQQAVYDFRMGRYQERILKYPNDLQIRFELAQLYWEGGDVDNALQQFQMAQRSPQHRLMSIASLGQCFAAKNQFDMAVEQFDRALAEMPVMDDNKKLTLYNLGMTYEKMNDMAKAMDCFKQIYSNDVNYKDVSAKMSAFYAAKNA